MHRLFVFALAVAMLAACGESQFSGGGGKKPATAKPDEKPKPENADVNKMDGENPHDEDDEPQASRPSEELDDAGSDEEEAPISSNATAVTKGSFTVWAEPPNPGSLQDYDIVIAVKLPKSAKGYQISDLSGSLSGTDGYHQGIPNGPASDGTPLPPAALVSSGKTAQVRIRVPGAFFAKTQDTVQLKSTLLNEQQTVTIVFR